LLNEAAMNSWNALQTTKTPWKFGFINLAPPSVRKQSNAFCVAKFDYIFLWSITSFGYIQKFQKESWNVVHES
jgi:hypothetical protein